MPRPFVDALQLEREDGLEEDSPRGRAAGTREGAVGKACRPTKLACAQSADRRSVVDVVEHVECLGTERQVELAARAGSAHTARAAATTAESAGAKSAAGASSATATTTATAAATRRSTARPAVCNSAGRFRLGSNADGLAEAQVEGHARRSVPQIHRYERIPLPGICVQAAELRLKVLVAACGTQRGIGEGWPIVEELIACQIVA